MIGGEDKRKLNYTQPQGYYDRFNYVVNIIRNQTNVIGS